MYLRGLNGFGEAGVSHDDASYGGDTSDFSIPDFSLPDISMPDASLPSAGAFNPSEWTNLIGKAISTYGQVRVSENQVQQSLATRLPPARSPLSLSPSYSPFPGMKTGGNGPMGLSMPVLLGGGALLAAFALMMSRR